MKAAQEDPEASEVERVYSSTAMLRLSDVILKLKREELALLLSSYLVFRSGGRSGHDLTMFLLTKHLGNTARIGLRVFPSIAVGFLSDPEFRSLVVRLLAPPTATRKA